MSIYSKFSFLFYSTEREKYMCVWIWSISGFVVHYVIMKAKPSYDLIEGFEFNIHWVIGKPQCTTTERMKHLQSIEFHIFCDFLSLLAAPNNSSYLFARETIANECKNIETDVMEKRPSKGEEKKQIEFTLWTECQQRGEPIWWFERQQLNDSFH